MIKTFCSMMDAMTNAKSSMAIIVQERNLFATQLVGMERKLLMNNAMTITFFQMMGVLRHVLLRLMDTATIL